MSPYQEIALVGATGTLGSPILSALHETSFSLTVLTRKDSVSLKDLEDSRLKVIPVDYESIDSIAAGLRGIHAVVCAIGSAAIPLQIRIINAAIKVGVKRFIPSEFGADTFNELSNKLPVYASKVAVQKHLQEAADKDQIEWTAIFGGPFLDWGLARGLLGFYPKEKKAVLYDGGARPFSTTLLADLGQAVVGVLENPTASRNKPIYVQSLRISQLELLNIFEDLIGTKWQRVHVSTVDLEKSGLEKLGRRDISGVSDLLLRAIYGEGFGCDFSGREQNAQVKVNELSRDDCIRLVKRQLQFSNSSGVLCKET